MRPLSRTAVWICLAIVALPLSPCAFFSSACGGTVHAAQAEPVSAERSCCAEHSKPASEPVQGDEDSCPQDCCKLSPFVPPAVPVVHDAPQLLAMVAILPEVSSAVSSPRELERDLPAVAIPLHVLHCQWRI